MKKAAVPLVLLLLLAQMAVGENLTIAYLEGEVQLQSGSALTQLTIGESIPLDASIRLTDCAFVQVKGAGVELALIRPGIYKVRDIARIRRLLSSPEITSALTGSLMYLLFGPAKRGATALGTRGAEENKFENEGWTESGAEVFLTAGKEYVKRGKYQKAIEQFNKALASATDQEAPRVHFYLGYASSLNGDVREAWKHASSLKSSTSDPWASDFILLRAKLLEDVSAYSEAVGWLRQNDLSQDRQRAPLYYFLLGLGYRAADDSENATQVLSKVVAIAGESDLGKAADELLKRS